LATTVKLTINYFAVSETAINANKVKEIRNSQFQICYFCWQTL